MTFLSNAGVSVWYYHDLPASHHHNILMLSWILSGILVLGSHLCLVHEENMALKEFKGRMLPSAPSSTLTVTLSMPLWCGSFRCNTVRILVLPSGSILLLMLATDFDLEIVENYCLRNWVPFGVPWRSPLCCPWRVCTISMEVTWMVLERRLTPCCMHFWSPDCFLTWTVDIYLCPWILWMCCGIFYPLLLIVWTCIEC